MLQKIEHLFQNRKNILKTKDNKPQARKKSLTHARNHRYWENNRFLERPRI